MQGLLVYEMGPHGQKIRMGLLSSGRMRRQTKHSTTIPQRHPLVYIVRHSLACMPYPLDLRDAPAPPTFPSDRERLCQHSGFLYNIGYGL